MQKDTSVAIIGMGCIFPKSIGIKAFWNLLFNARDAITEIPEETHWSLKDYFHENPSTPDHTYCKKGGFIPTVSFDPARYGMPPNNLDATDTSQLLGLLVAEMALKDAGYPPGADFDRHRTNVILGVTGTQELVIPLGARLSHPIWRKALDDSGIPPEKTIEVLQRMSDAHTGWQENSFPGLLGNVVAGRIANRLDLGGTNTVVDAACASSLSAVQTACLELITGKCDMSVTGGVDTLNDIFMHMCFSKTGVLSHTSDARPFSKHADGTVLGEGIGMLVLKRLTDAEKDGNRIYAVIKSIGTSSDGKTGGIYAPDAQGQLRALKTAYSQADINPETVEMIEAHGTGTRVGDKIEFSALKQLMTENNRSNHCAVGSVKSMIGHAKAAAGAAGLIKAALSLHHKVIPPTLKAATPDPELNIDKTPFYLNDQSRPWLASHDHPRRSGVSAFGFGGSNFHAVLEEYQGQKNHVSWDGTVQIAAFSSDSIEKLKNQLVDFKVTFKDSDKLDATEKAELLAWHTSIQRKTFSSEAGFRLLFILHENDHIASKTDTALTLLDSPPDANQITPVKKSGIFFSARKDTGGIGFLFPGQGSQYTGMGRDIFSFFPEAIESLELAEKAFKNVWERSSYGIKNHIFPPPRYAMNKNKAEENLRNTDIAQPAIGSVSIAMCKVLKRFGVTPASTCGHSFGELPALYAAGWMDEETLFSLAVDRGKQMAARTDKKKDRGKMIAVKAPLEEIEAFIKKEKLDVVLANRNSHNQGILSGSSDEITKALKSCRANDLKAVELPVAAAFHSRLVEKAVRPFKKSVNGKTITPTDIPVLSNTTGTPYPDSSDKAKELLANQLINPVNFVKNIESMYQEGIHTFLEIGPKTVLTGLTRSILKGKPHAVLAMDGSSGRGSGIKDLANLLCQLSAMGINVALEKWEEQANQPEKKIMRVPLTGANIKPAAQCTLPPSPLMTTAPEKCEKSHASPLPMGDGHGARLKKQGINNRNERRAPSDFSSAPQSPITLKQNNQQLHIAKSHRSISKGADMASYNKQNKDIEHPVMGHSQQHSNRERGNHPCMPAGTPSSSLIRDAMQMVQQGLESMQALQASTARAHEKFLDTQAVASQSLQSMMEQTRFFAWNTISTVNGTHNREVDRPENSACTAAIQKYNRDTKPNNTSAAPTPARGNTNHTPLYSKETGVPPEIDYGTPQSITQSPLNDAQQHSQPHQKNQENGAPHQATGQFPDKRTATQTPAENTKDLLLATVSRLTGFPSEMLELNMDIESDLGIDSIKRVEILSELEKKLPQADALSPENMGTLRTLDDIYKALAPQQSSTETTGSFVMDSNQLEQEELNQSGFKTPDQTPDIDATTDTVEETGAFNFQNVMPILLNTISSLTGFPVEMLEPQMDLESDLGIDSIKRVEILSKLEQEIPKAASVSPDDMATLRTLEDIASHLAEKPTPSPENEKKKTV